MRPLFTHHSFGSKQGRKSDNGRSNQPGIVACAIILQNGWRDFEDGWLIKSNFITKG
jgi:hypothetical protein